MSLAARLSPAAALLASFLATAPLHAEPVAGSCLEGVCEVKLTAGQLLANASELVAEKRFAEAQPMLAALGNVPALAMETHFLRGYVAVETGQIDTAIEQFRASLAIDPKQTRVRLELARAMMMRGKDGAAAYHFRLAAQDKALTSEIRATILASRGILRDRRPWHFSTDFGIAPDTNINNGTSAQTVDVVIGDQTIPLDLDANARKRSGLGQTASISAGYRFKIGERGALLVDADLQGVNYAGSEADDYTLQIAAGPELRLSEDTSLSVQGLGLQRWYGGTRAVTQAGLRLNAQHSIDEAQRVGLTLDMRHSASGFQSDYSGWNLALYATYERVVSRSMIASASLFARTDRLNQAAYSNKEFGLSLGIGGELAHGINAGVNGTFSRATFDAALLALSDTPRSDWRLGARVYAGIRSIRVMGFSPSVSYNYQLNASSLDLFASNRSRFTFSLARYF